MSIVVVLAEREQVVVGTDSRFLRQDFTGIASDSAPKIFNVAPDTFIAPSGWRLVCDAQPAKARELARALSTSDVRVLADALDRASRPVLEDLVRELGANRELAPKIGDALCGREPLHGVLLAGRSNGRLGYVFCQYVLQSGRIELEKTEYFGDDRQITATAWQHVQHLSFDPATGTDDAVAVVKRYLETARSRSWHVGGPDQLVRITDERSAEWLSAPLIPTTADHLAVSTALFQGTTTFQRAGSSTAVIIRDTDLTLQGAGLGYVRADATSVGVYSGGTPKLIATSTVLALYGAGTATAVLDATQLKLDSGIGPKAIVSSAGVVIDSNVGPKTIVNSAGVIIDSGSTPKVSIASSGVNIIGPNGTIALNSRGAVISGDNLAPVLYDWSVTMIPGNRVFTDHVKARGYSTDEHDGVDGSVSIPDGGGGGTTLNFAKGLFTGATFY